MKQRRQMTKFEVLWREKAHELKGYFCLQVSYAFMPVWYLDNENKYSFYI